MVQRVTLWVEFMAGYTGVIMGMSDFLCECVCACVCVVVCVVVCVCGWGWSSWLDTQE